MKVDICLPIYNEEKIIAQSISDLTGYLSQENLPIDWRVVIVNNGSRDNSESICRQLETDKIKLINIKDPGRGQALRKYWNESDADIVFYMDSDLAVHLKNIKDLIEEFVSNNADVVIGSRMLPDSQIERSFLREIMSRSCNLAYRAIIGFKISDTQCGFKAIKTDKFKKIYPYLRDNKWFFDTEIITFSKLQNYNLKEIPVIWKEERYDQRKSKVKVLRDSWLHFKNLALLRRQINKLNKQKIFPII